MKNKFRILGMFLFGALLLGGLVLSSCKKDDDDDDDGKIDPNTIAATNLIAHFDFESLPTAGAAVPFSNNTITFGSKVGAASIVAGRRGNAYQGSASEAYFEYNITGATALKSLDEFTMACWIKAPATTDGAAKIFAINGGDGFMGNLTLMQESRPGDSLDMKVYLFDSESPEWKGQDIRIQNQKFLDDLWFHVVAVYRKETSAIELWANGVFVAQSIRYAGPDPDGDGPLPQPLLGPIKLGQDMTKLHFGAWPQQIAGNPEGWMTYFAGLVDEYRVYNKALSEAEILELYQAEVTQIN
jgi:hypothetical protein